MQGLFVTLAAFLLCLGSVGDFGGVKLIRFFGRSLETVVIIRIGAVMIARGAVRSGFRGKRSRHLPASADCGNNQIGEACDAEHQHCDTQYQYKVTVVALGGVLLNKGEVVAVGHAAVFVGFCNTAADIGQQNGAWIPACSSAIIRAL